MKHYDYMTVGTCSQMISFDLDGEKVYNISFMGGCNGNLKAIPILVDGMSVSMIESKLKGVLCGRRPTSCPDQLATAVRQALDGKLEAAE